MCPGLLETRWYAQRGIPAYAYGPGDLEVAHQADEHVEIPRLLRAVEIYARTARRSSGAEESESPRRVSGEPAGSLTRGGVIVERGSSATLTRTAACNASVVKPRLTAICIGCYIVWLSKISPYSSSVAWRNSRSCCARRPTAAAASARCWCWPGCDADGPQRVTELAAAERVAQPTMTGLIGRLEADGLVRKTADPADARAVRVELTDAGRDQLAAVRAERAEALAGPARSSRRRRPRGARRRPPRPRPIDRHMTHRFLDQPRSVWAVAFACVVAFMGIGLVDPILPVLAHDLDATPSQVSLLFTSYFAMTGLSMLVTGWFASRIGPRRTLLVGLALVVVFSALAGLSDTVFQIAGFRLGWGLGNALFIATALSVIVGAATGGLTSAIILYEAALGLGIASGPLLGGLLGDVSWRGPFFGTAVLMAIGFILIATLLGPVAKPVHRVSILDPLRALSPRRPALDGDRGRALQLRLLHDPRLHAAAAGDDGAPARARSTSAGACWWR